MQDFLALPSTWEGKWAQAESLTTHLPVTQMSLVQPCPCVAWVSPGSTLRLG